MADVPSTSYQNGLEVISTVQSYREVVADVILTFEIVTARYVELCRNALGHAVQSDATCEKLLDHPDDVGWYDALLVQRMVDRMGDKHYSLFVKLVQRLHRHIMKLSERLCLQIDSKQTLEPTWLNQDPTVSTKVMMAARSKKFLKCISIGLQKNKLDSSIQEIEADLGRLEQLLPRSTNNVTVQTSRRSTIPTAWKCLREGASRLFDAIASGWSCNCQQDHAACLRLEPRSLEDTKVQFNVLFMFDDSKLTSAQGPWKWQDVEIESIQQEIKQSHHAQPQSTKSHKQQPKRVTITEITHAIPSLSLNNSQAFSALSRSALGAQKIKSLCQHLQGLPCQSPCLGFLESHSWQHHIFTSSTRHRLEPCWSRLDDLCMTNQQSQATQLTRLTTGSPAARWTTKERYRMAYTLASSVLQLADTPWLLSCWKLRHIYLNNVNTAAQPNIPYLRSDFKGTAPVQSHPRPFIRNEVVFALGVALLELYYGASLISMRYQEPVDANGDPTPWTEPSIADRLILDLQHNEAEQGYVDAARWCIHGNLSCAGKDFENNTFLGEYCSTVLTPLEEICVRVLK